MIDVINNSALPNDLKGKFLVAMRNVQTLEQLKKAVPRIQARIDKMVHKKRRGVVLKQLKKVIKSTKTKGTKGKFGAEVGDILNNVRKAFGLSDEAAQKILDVQSEAGTTEIPNVSCVRLTKAGLMLSWRRSSCLTKAATLTRVKRTPSNASLNL